MANKTGNLAAGLLGMTQQDPDLQRLLLEMLLGMGGSGAPAPVQKPFGIGGLPGFERFTDARANTIGPIPISPVGPGTLGGAPFRVNPIAEAIRGLAALATNVQEAQRVRKKRKSQAETLTEVVGK